MASMNAFLELWRGFSLDAATLPHSIGVDEVPRTDIDSATLGELRDTELNERYQRVVALAPQFLDTEDRLVAQTFPSWLSCVSDDVILRWSLEFSTLAFAEGAAKVLHTRIAQENDYRPWHVLANARHGSSVAPESDAVRARFDRVVERCGEPTRLALERLHASYLSLLNAGDATAAPTSGSGSIVRQTVIVHGTWAASSTWWRDPSGLGTPPTTDSLWHYLSPKVINSLVGYGHEFFWSGGNSDADRRQGAQDFVDWYQPCGIDAAPRLPTAGYAEGGPGLR